MTRVVAKYYLTVTRVVDFKDEGCITISHTLSHWLLRNTCKMTFHLTRIAQCKSHLTRIAQYHQQMF